MKRRTGYQVMMVVFVILCVGELIKSQGQTGDALMRSLFDGAVFAGFAIASWAVSCLVD